MRYSLLIILGLLTALSSGCEEERSAQDIVDEAIENAGGSLYQDSEVRFIFREREYIRSFENNREVLKRITRKADTVYTDIRKGDSFQRFLNGQPVQLADSLARSMSNSVNSVHYFAYLPFGLNDPAVNKRLLGKSVIKGREYYEVEVTFNQEGGGDDFEDVYIYWFNTTTGKPDYLAYLFHIDGGGLRFREAVNERYVGGLRFVDYKNYKPTSDTVRVADLDTLFEKGSLELLSEINLEEIAVNRGNYN